MSAGFMFNRVQKYLIVNSTLDALAENSGALSMRTLKFHGRKVKGAYSVSPSAERVN